MKNHGDMASGMAKIANVKGPVGSLGLSVCVVFQPFRNWSKIKEIENPFTGVIFRF